MSFEQECGGWGIGLSGKGRETTEWCSCEVHRLEAKAQPASSGVLVFWTCTVPAFKRGGISWMSECVISAEKTYGDDQVY